MTFDCALQAATDGQSKNRSEKAGRGYGGGPFICQLSTNDATKKSLGVVDALYGECDL